MPLVTRSGPARRFVVVAALLANAMGHLSAQNSSNNPIIQQAIDEIRGIVREAGDISAGYAALLNFAGNPDVSTATYYVDSDLSDDPELNVFRGSLRQSIGGEDSNWKPFFQGIFPYETYRYGENYIDDNSVTVKWEAFGIMGMLGAEYQVSESFAITPAVNFGWLRLKNDASYRGDFAKEVLEPAFNNLVYDWTTDTLVYGLSLWADYTWEFERFDSAVHAGITYNHIRSIHSTSDYIDFSAGATTLAASAETIHPTGINLQGFPIALVLSAGGTTFVGPDRNALGFNSFFDGGIAFQANISRLGYSVKSVRLGGKAIWGENVTGWSFTFDYDF